MSHLSYNQQVALAITPKVTASIGMISSLFIITEVVRDHRNKRGNPIHRVLLFVTTFEILDSFGWFLSSWAIPRDTGFVFAVGTQRTCNFQGLLLQLAIGAPLHNCILTYFFYLVVTYKYTTQQLNLLEWKVHSVIVLYAFTSGIIFLLLDLYNPTNQVCWVYGDPKGCGQSKFRNSINTDDASTTVPCDRGDYAYLYGFFGFYFLVWCVIIIIIVLNISMRRSLMLLRANDDAAWITKQALLFSLAFFVTWGPSTIWSTFHWIGDTSTSTTNDTNNGFRIQTFWPDLIASFCEPLQGFWNMLIFIRDRPHSIQRIRNVFCYVCHYRRTLGMDSSHNNNNNHDNNTIDASDDDDVDDNSFETNDNDDNDNNDDDNKNGVDEITTYNINNDDADDDHSYKGESSLEMVQIPPPTSPEGLVTSVIVPGANPEVSNDTIHDEVPTTTVVPQVNGSTQLPTSENQ